LHINRNPINPRTMDFCLFCNFYIKLSTLEITCTECFWGMQMTRINADFICFILVNPRHLCYLRSPKTFLTASCSIIDQPGVRSSISLEFGHLCPSVEITYTEIVSKLNIFG
jgi:hypothetical protein